MSAGVVGGLPMLDRCADVDFNVVMNGEGRFIEMQGTAEGAPFDRKMMGKLLDMAAQGIGRLLQVQHTILGQEGAI